MGIFNDLKKVLFGAKAVTKHGAEKAKESVTEKKDELVVEAEKVLEDLKIEFEAKKQETKEKSQGVKDKVVDEAKEIWDKTMEKSSEIIDDIQQSPAYKKTTETIEKVGDTVLDTGEKFYDKTKEFIDGPGKEMADMAKEISEDMGDKITSAGKTIVEKGKEVADSIGDKFDDTFKKAQEEAELEKSKPKSEFADTPIDTGESLLKDKGGFFDKAERYAEGGYSDKPELLEEKTEIKESDKKTDIPGFEDVDKDGDDLIDDAEIIEDNKE